MHTYKQNGDTMYDPMMVFEVDRKAKTATAVEFEQSNPPLYQRVDEDGVGHSIDGNGNERVINSLQGQLDRFASQWFENIGNQGYMPVRATMLDAGYADATVYYNSDSKPFCLAFMFDSEGTTVLNNLDKDSGGNLVKVAHVDSYRNIEYLEQNLPADVVQIISEVKLVNEKKAPEHAENSQEKQYSLGFGYIGSANSPDGVEVWNWHDEKPAGGYNIVATISAEREVTFIDDNMPDSIKNEIIDKAKTAVMSQEKPETPPLGVGDYVVTSGNAFLLGHGRIVALADEDYPGSTEHFIVDFGDNEICTVHKDDMSAEIVQGYKIMQRIEISDTEGAVFAHNPNAPDPYVTWMYIDRDGERDYYSGQYRQTEESAIAGLHQRAEVGSPNLHQPPPAAPAPAPEPTMSTFPLYKENLAHAVDYDEREIYNQSRQFNFKCRDFIDNAIEKSRKAIPGAPAGAATYDMKSAVWAVIGECGRERAEWVLAANINAAVAVNDGRITPENREWAKNIGAPERHDYHIQAHRTVLDGFARRFRESEKEKPPMSFLYAQAQQRKAAAEAGKSNGAVEQSAQKKNDER